MANKAVIALTAVVVLMVFMASLFWLFDNKGRAFIKFHKTNLKLLMINNKEKNNLLFISITSHGET